MAAKRSSRSKLDEYARKRDFAETPEPAGAPPADAAEPDQPRFVVQQHDATALHWDLRLERDGVLLSWALPRGIPASGDDDHLAVRTEDHPLEYLDFEGDIPDGNYGAGHMTVYEHGTYEPVKVEDRKLIVRFHGERTEGTYALFATRGKNWMIHRMDPPQDPERHPPPLDWKPMRATPGSLPDEEDAFAYEIDWPGRRVQLACTPGHVLILDAAGNDLSDRLTEIKRITRPVGAHDALLDAVLAPAASLEDDSVARRLDPAELTASRLRRLRTDRPLRVILFDVLWADGYPTIDLPYEERRTRLDDLGLHRGEAWEVPAFHRGDGAALLEAATAQGLPGLVAKRLDSVYRPGTSSPDWIAVPAGADPS